MNLLGKNTTRNYGFSAGELRNSGFFKRFDTFGLEKKKSTRRRSFWNIEIEQLHFLQTTVNTCMLFFQRTYKTPHVSTTICCYWIQLKKLLGNHSKFQLKFLKCSWRFSKFPLQVFYFQILAAKCEIENEAHSL